MCDVLDRDRLADALSLSVDRDPGSHPPRPLRESWPHWLEIAAIGCVLLAYALLAVAYSTVTPILESYDERFHFAYVLSIALDHGLPIQDVSNPGPWGNEGSQPPLYYVLSALVSSWTSQRGFADHIEPNPYATRHLDVEQDDNRNFFLHHRNEDYPYVGNVLAIHLARWISVLFGGMAILATYATGRLVLPGRPMFALTVAAFQAFIPSFIYVSSTASNDAAVIALSALALWQVVVLTRDEASPMARVLWLGCLIGLATLAKLSALPLVAVAALGIFWASGGLAQWRRILRQILLLLISLGVVAGWWFVRNWNLYQEWLGTDTMNRIAGLRAQPPTGLQLWDELRLDIERNFWVAFGSANIHPPDFWLLLPRMLALAGLAASALLLARRWTNWRRSPHYRRDRRTIIIFAVWVALFVASFGWWLWHVEHLNGRLLYPLLTPLSLAIIYGIYRSTPEAARSFVCAAITLSMCALAAAMLPVALLPAYARPPVVTETQVGRVPRQVDVLYDGKIRLRAMSLEEREVEVGQPIHTELFWQSVVLLDTNYTVYTHLLDPNGRMIAGTDTLPGRGSLPTIDWLPNTIYRDRIPVYLDNLPDEPIVASLVVGWYETASQRSLIAKASDGRRLNPLTVDRIRVPAATAHPYRPSHALAADFGEVIDLIGYDLSDNALTLYWRARATVGADFTVFVHVLDDESRIIAQSDGTPRGGAYPTSFWIPGEVVRDIHLVQLPTDYARIIVGLYRPDTGQRLPLVGQSVDAAIIMQNR